MGNLPATEPNSLRDQRVSKRDSVRKNEARAACILTGDARDLEQIKDYIIREYVNTGKVNMEIHTNKKKDLHLLTEAKWKQYQKLRRMIGGGFP